MTYAQIVLRLERVPLDGVDPAIEAQRGRNVFQTREWLEFVARTQGAEPVVLHFERDGVAVGAFTGLIVRRFGVRILGSPFQGWMTGPMGFTPRAGRGPRGGREGADAVRVPQPRLPARRVDGPAVVLRGARRSARPAGRVPNLRARPEAERGGSVRGDEELLPPRDQEGGEGRRARRGGPRRRVRRRVLRAAARRVRASGPPAALRGRAGARDDPLRRAERQPAHAPCRGARRGADRDRPVSRLRGLRLLLGRRELHQPPVPAPQRRDLLARDEALPRARGRAPRPRRWRRLQAQVRGHGEADPVRAQVPRAGAASPARPGGVRLQAARDARTAPPPGAQPRRAQCGRPEHPRRRAGRRRHAILHRASGLGGPVAALL